MENELTKQQVLDNMREYEELLREVQQVQELFGSIRYGRTGERGLE